MVWWAWFVLAAILMGAELMVVDVAFYLMFIGFAAAITGFIGMLGVTLEVWLQWIVFSVLAIGSMLMFRKRLYEKLRGNAPGFDATPLGELLQLNDNLAPGDSCRASYRGSSWTVRNDGTKLIEKGSSTEITAIDGLTLVVGG